jgi:hypothetical protein
MKAVSGYKLFACCLKICVEKMNLLCGNWKFYALSVDWGACMRYNNKLRE